MTIHYSKGWDPPVLTAAMSLLSRYHWGRSGGDRTASLGTGRIEHVPTILMQPTFPPSR
jgi:hypothetical protein